MINIVDIWNYLKTIPAIDTALNSQIFYGKPPQELTTPYMYMQVITNNTQTAVQETIRVEFRIIDPRSEWTFANLQNISKLIYDNLAIYREQNVIKVINSNNVQDYDEKNAKTFIRDLIFYQVIN